MISVRTPEKAAQHKAYEESLQSTEKSVLATLKELTSPLAATSSTDDGTSNHFSPTAFKERLETYQTSTYFAKPVSLSPIICARFGWINTEKDILQCPVCNAVICVDINSNLSHAASQTIIQKYREMLVTSHDDNGKCPFRNDAEKWLLSPKGEAKEKMHEEFSVPPYLLALSDEYHLFEYTHTATLIKRLGKESVKIYKALNTKESYEISLPKIANEMILQYFHNIDAFISAFISSFQIYDDTEYNDDDMNHRELTKDCLFLACFGWRLDTTKYEELSSETHVKCEICNTCAVLSSIGTTEKKRTEKIVPEIAIENLSEVPKAQELPEKEEFTLAKRKRIYAIKYHYDHPDGGNSAKKLCQTKNAKSKYYKRPSPCKRRRTMNKDEEQKYMKTDTYEEIAKSKMTFHTDFDLQNSHRHYCPYHCGLQIESGSEKATMETKPGWILILSKVLSFLSQSNDDVTLLSCEKSVLGSIIKA